MKQDQVFRLFFHRLISYLCSKVEKYGEVTDFFNPGRGFAFITFSTNEEAQACIKGMDNTEVRSTLVKFEISRQS